MKIKIFKWPTAFAIAALFAGASWAETLTLNECLAEAMSKNPDLAAYGEKIAAQRAAIGQAASAGRLQLSAGTSYTRRGMGLTNENNDGSYSTNVSAEQSISDWGRREARVAGAKLSTEAAEADLLAERDTVVQNVCLAYYGLNRATRENQVAQTRCDNFEKRLKWARSYYEVGTKAKIEVTKAEADLASSKLAVVQTQASMAKFRAELANAMGEPMREIGAVEDLLDYQDWSMSLEEAVKRAQQERPELAAKQKRVEYAKTNLTVQMKGLSPSLSASAGYSLGASSPFEDGEWSTKISLSVPITDGGLTKSNIEQAEAELRTAQAELRSLSNSVALEVREAWEALREAKESLASSTEAERSAKATLDLAEGRYAAGVGDNLEISDAVDSYASASAKRVLALYDCKAARLDLEKAIGGLNYGER